MKSIIQHVGISAYKPWYILQGPSSFTSYLKNLKNNLHISENEKYEPIS
ncbi:hypothetical protein SAMN05660862_0474 [Sphingobacterium psychroaquaticum]|uniref:Uncharacterized protein n=1 Tax=Sphingobacterium psychroaquaticum TaxID=561061 RepID=A0A1X7I6H2_9SPHI|nr:hypothetical protein SAMN05660862_0474 [Sphingobacterium psychroaquaticum]